MEHQSQRDRSPRPLVASQASHLLEGPLGCMSGSQSIYESDKQIQTSGLECYHIIIRDVVNTAASEIPLFVALGPLIYDAACRTTFPSETAFYDRQLCICYLSVCSCFGRYHSLCLAIYVALLRCCSRCKGMKHAKYLVVDGKRKSG